MGLSCDCSGDYDWYYDLPEQTRIAVSDGKCYGCCGDIHVGDEVRRIFSYEIDEDGDEVNEEVIGRICETCSDLYDSLMELGFCITADVGFITQSMADYRELYGSRHVQKKA